MKMDEQDGMMERQAGTEEAIASEEVAAAEEVAIPKLAAAAGVTAADEGTNPTGAAVPAEAASDAGQEAGAREAEWQRRLEAYAAKAVFSEARAAAAALGVPENRLDYAARLADTAGVDSEAPDARTANAAAVQKVLKDVPELLGGAGTGRTLGARRPRRGAFERGFMGD
jgi:hypothetical protein